MFHVKQKTKGDLIMNDAPLKDWQNCHERLWLSIAEHILVNGKTSNIAALKIKILKELNMIDLVEQLSYCFLCSHVFWCWDCWLVRNDYSCKIIYNEFNNFNQRQQFIASIRIATIIYATDYNFTLSQCYAKALSMIKLDLMCDPALFRKAFAFEMLLAENGLLEV